MRGDEKIEELGKKKSDETLIGDEEEEEEAKSSLSINTTGWQEILMTWLYKYTRHFLRDSNGI